MKYLIKRWRVMGYTDCVGLNTAKGNAFGPNKTVCVNLVVVSIEGL